MTDIERVADSPIADTDIAVVGMACRFPGASTPRHYWKNLRDGVESVTPRSDEDLLVAGTDPALLADPNYVKSSVLLEGFDTFDAGFFGFSPRDAGIMDPQQRIFLECAWEAFESAGRCPSKFDGSVGVFAGCGMTSYMMFNILTNPSLIQQVGLFLLRHTGNDKDFLATRVSYQFDLKGPSINIQTACSTSLVAIHTAAQSLLGGECDMALAGGVTVEIPHGRGYLYQEGEILSPDGHCRAFDHRSRGTVFGSGAGAVVLRRLGDAIEEGDRILAVIKGSAINNDGSGKVGYLAPSVEGHSAVISEALSLAGVDPDTISYVEAHGTGTPVGDPIEIRAFTEAYRQSTERRGYCGIGSVKTNIGHLDTAAGVASFMKVVLAMQNRELPPSLNFEKPNPILEIESSPFYVNDRLQPWSPEGARRRAGVSSLGVGGTNAHVVLEETPELQPTGPSRPWQLLPLSARSASAVDSATDRLAEHLRRDEETPLADIAFTLQVGRETFGHRRYLVCRDRDDAIEALGSKDRKRLVTRVGDERSPAVVYLFPGGGAQYPGMAREIYESEPAYREAFDACFEILRKHDLGRLRDLMFPAAGDEEAAARQLERPLDSIVSIFVTEYALAKLWMRWGIEPAAMTGHSLGEYTAACLAGVQSLEDTIQLVVHRGRIFERMREGAMLSVSLPESELAKRLGEGLSLAAINAPELCAVSGEVAAIDTLQKELEAEEIDCRRIKISVAAHSPMLDEFLDEFAQVARTIEQRAPEIPYVSNLTGTWITAEEATDPTYWVRHLRSTVRFADGLATLLDDEDRIFLEVGPGTTLTSLVRQHPDRSRQQAALSSMRHPKEPASDLEFLLGAIGGLWQNGVSIDWSAFYERETRRRVELPTYPFERQRYWIEPGKSAAGDAAPNPLAKIPEIDEWFYRPVWAASEIVKETPDSGKRHTWLVFHDESRSHRRFLETLRERGDRVVSVAAGDAFHCAREDEYVIAPERREEYIELLEELAEQDALPDVVLHLWMVTEKQVARPGSSFFHRNQECGFYSLVSLAQAIGDADLSQPLQVSVVSSDMQQVFGEAVPHPEKALVLGPSLVIPREYPGVHCKSIDVSLGELLEGSDASRATISSILADACSHDEAEQIAYRRGQRYVKTFDRTRLKAAAHEPVRLREGGVYLVTGGLGGIGLELAESLARNWKARLVLVGRSSLPEREAWDDWIRNHSARDPVSLKIQRVRHIESLGGEVLVARADVANVEDVEAVVAAARRRFGAVHGVVHAAGVLEDGVIQLKSALSISHVFSPKVHGTRILYDQLAGEELDFMLLFSSTSSIFGAVGQVDYTAANAYLNAFAQSHAGRSRPYVVAVNWGIWQEVGMAVRAASGHGRRDLGREVEHLQVGHPLLDERVLSSSDETVFASQYRCGDHWLLDEHRLASGEAIVPGTGYIELARAAAATQNGATGPLELRDLMFLSPLYVPDDATREVRVSLWRDASWQRFEVSSQSAGGGPDSWLTHAQGRLRVAPAERPGRAVVREIEERCGKQLQDGSSGSLRTRQEDHLSFGPRWRNLRKIGYGDGEAIALLELDEAYEDDLQSFELHPALLDMATGFAMSLIEGYDERGETLYVPMTYGRLRAFAPLKRRIYSHVRSRGDNAVENAVAKFDVTLYDEMGEVLVAIDDFAIKKLEGDLDVAGASRREPGSDVGAHHGGGAQMTEQERRFQTMIANGIRPDEGTRVFERVLRSCELPQVVATSIDLDHLIDEVRRKPTEEAEAGAKFSRPELGSEYLEPRDDVERTLVGIWQDLLGVDTVGVLDDFFELGGYSLIAVRLFNQIKKIYGVEFPLSVLFEAPTVELCAGMIKEEVGDLGGSDAGAAGEAPKKRARKDYSLLVKLQEGSDPERPPFFLIAGMFGNIMNLRHLASHIGEDQTTYGVQARGLFGDDTPHTRFEPMAEDYLREIRKIQPHGPYYLGGFSGGGVTAYEMAQQLRAIGEETAIVVMIDTPCTDRPEITMKERLALQLVHLRRGGVGYLGRWLRDRMEWKRRERERERSAQHAEVLAQRPTDFRSEAIKDAFYEAVAHYRVRPYSGRVVLFRPKFETQANVHRIGGRYVREDWEILDEQNHWQAYITEGLETHVVPGDHDSMVLEPHVRVLAAKMRAALDEAVPQLKVEALNR